MIKLSDITQAMGVSTATISNALTGKGRMKDETHRHIRETALAMGYVLPQPAGSRGRNILVITEANRITFSSRIASGLSMAAQKADVACVICDLAILHIVLGRNASAEQLRPMVTRVLSQQDAARADRPWPCVPSKAGMDRRLGGGFPPRTDPKPAAFQQPP